MASHSILDSYLQNAQQHGDETAALVRTNGVYKPVTWQQMFQRTQKLATALLQAGLAPGDRVCLIAQTSLDWVIVDMAIIAAGAITVPIYPSNLAGECHYVVQDSASVMVVAETHEQTQKFLQGQSELPSLKKIIQMTGAVDDNPLVVGLDSLIDGVEKIDEVELAKRRESIRSDSPFSIIYTSGTTGHPKGVITTHDNMLYEAEAINAVDILRKTDVQLVFLPFAHVFARVLEIAWLAIGHTMAFAENMNTIRQDMADSHPNLMAGVPRVYEKFYTAVLAQGRQKGGLSAVLFERALKLSEKNGQSEMGGPKLSAIEALQFRILKGLVFKKIAQGLGATLGGRMRLMISGGAPLAPKIAHFFRDAGIDILEGFGLTETCAATCVNLPGSNHIGTVGKPLPGTQARLAEDGELLLKGRGVTPGYWGHAQDAGREVLHDGWFATGDIATIEHDGSVRIVDRKKDLIVTAGGKNVAPQNIENLLKTNPIISQAVVYGDKRNFLTALITLDADNLKVFAKNKKLGEDSLAALSQRGEVFGEVERIVQNLNAQLARYETIKKFKILEHDFTQESGELTPSLKIKRKVINQRYKTIFDSFYSESF